MSAYRETFMKLGLMEDWEYTDSELLDRLHRLLFGLNADPFNCRRKVDYECQLLMIHAGDRCRILAEMRNA